MLNPENDSLEITEITEEVEDYGFDERFELLKKQPNEISEEVLEELEIAKIKPDNVRSDYLDNEKNINLRF